MKSRDRVSKIRGLVLLAALVCMLALPTAASAHPSVYTSGAKAVPTSPPSPIGYGDLQDRTRYVVTNHNIAYVMEEENLESDKGMLDYKLLPGAWRGQPGVTTADLFTYGDTGVQPHHTCKTSALEAESAITAWQEVSSAGKPEPFYRYVPFQKASAGLDDHPDKWIPVVKTRTGVDLSTVSDVPATAATQLQALCEGLPGGVFVKADKVVTPATGFNSATIAAAVNPLNAQILGLQTSLGAAQAEVAKLQTPLKMNLQGKVNSKGATLTVTGPAGEGVTVRATVKKSDRRTGLTAGLLGQVSGTIGSDGKAQLKMKLSSKAKKALRKAKGSKVSFSGVLTDSTASAAGKI